MRGKSQLVAVCMVLCAAALVFLKIPKVSADGFPRDVQTVSEVDIIGQVGSLPETTLFTPTQTGLYRVSAYLVVTSRGSQGNLYGFALWTDVTGIQRFQLGYLCTNEVGCSQTSSVVTYAVAGQPILVKTSNNAVAPPTYNMYVTAEKL
jgi:hypothetical protein